MTIRFSKDYDPQRVAVILGEVVDLLNSVDLSDISGITDRAALVDQGNTFQGGQTFENDIILEGDLVLSPAGNIIVDGNAKTLVSNAVDMTGSIVARVTTEALTTAAGASQAFVLTRTGTANTDLAIITLAGGTNTRKNITLEVVCTTDTVTVTVYNTEPTNALNGTIKFNILMLKTD